MYVYTKKTEILYKKILNKVCPYSGLNFSYNLLSKYGSAKISWIVDFGYNKVFLGIRVISAILFTSKGLRNVEYVGLSKVKNIEQVFLDYLNNQGNKLYIKSQVRFPPSKESIIELILYYKALFKILFLLHKISEKRIKSK